MPTFRTTHAAMAIGVLILAAAAAQVEAQEPSLVLSGPIQFPDGTLQESAMNGLALVADTGQRRCWDEAGTEIACSGTGQDGELQAGLPWPTPRFTSNLDGTVTDNLTALVWLRDADCFGSQAWSDAIVSADSLMDGVCSLNDDSAPTDWRLPNIRELQSLIDFSQTYPALPIGHPFADVRDKFYWTSTTAVDAPQNAWAVGLYYGGADNGSKAGFFHVWPVRDASAPGAGGDGQ